MKDGLRYPDTEAYNDISLHYITLIFIMRFSQEAQSAYKHKMLLKYTYNKTITLKLTVETMIAK